MAKPNTGHSGTTKVSLSDIEQQLRSITGSANQAIKESKTTAGMAAASLGLGGAALAYLLGRRRGRRRATVLEIRRV